MVICVFDVHQKLQRKIKKVYEFARKTLKLQRDKTKTRLDMHATRTTFERCEPVCLYNPKRKKGLQGIRNFNETGRAGAQACHIQFSARSKPKVVHIMRLLPYHGTDPPCWLLSLR
ncbi:unnamed protein product [Diabrotica balteata]|uniref:Uncharacterized protein n=1 Tax=Diabrotica balteata TaxID=107213 RepID=A0A9N9SZM2_DIABA|nr:unnamed protein product [Diabrotica balteata]